MRSNYIVKSKQKGLCMPRSGVQGRPVLDGLEDRTFFAATPMAMPMPHFMPQAIAIEVAPVVMANAGFGHAHVGFEVIVIRQGVPVFAPHEFEAQPPAFGDHSSSPVASTGGGDAPESGRAHVVTTQPPAAMSVAQTVVANRWKGMDSGSSPVIAAGQDLPVNTTPAAGASAIESSHAVDFLRLDSASSAGLSAVVSSPAASVQGTAALPNGITMAGIAAAFPAGLSSWLANAARPLKQTVVTLTSMMSPMSVTNVFSTASPSEFLKAAAPGLAAALSSLGNLTTHAGSPGGEGSAAWRNAAVVGAGLAVAGYGYTALQRRKADAEAAGAAEELSRKQWDLQSLEKR